MTVGVCAPISKPLGWIFSARLFQFFLSPRKVGWHLLVLKAISWRMRFPSCDLEVWFDSMCQMGRSALHYLSISKMVEQHKPTMMTELPTGLSPCLFLRGKRRGRKGIYQLDWLAD